MDFREREWDDTNCVIRLGTMSMGGFHEFGEDIWFHRMLGNSLVAG
jgi:hypothetical protein